jgi:hypothetical protein
MSSRRCDGCGYRLVVSKIAYLSVSCRMGLNELVIALRSLLALIVPVPHGLEALLIDGELLQIVPLEIMCPRTQQH